MSNFLKLKVANINIYYIRKVNKQLTMMELTDHIDRNLPSDWLDLIVIFGLTTEFIVMMVPL